ncbi:MAG: hypothetical protein Q4E62_09330, partial [Sutterellaceae bacterium]|nr:hypothetical protein [Sutterellaceae bacterium]
MLKNKHFALCTIAAAVLSAVCVTTVNAEDFSGSSWNQSGEITYDKFSIENSDLTGMVAVELGSQNTTLTVTDDFSVIVGRTSENIYQDVIGVWLSTDGTTLTTQKGLKIQVTNNSTSNVSGYGTIGLSSAGGAVALGTGSNTVTVTNSNGDNYVNGVYMANGAILSGANLTVVATNEAEGRVEDPENSWIEIPNNTF